MDLGKCAELNAHDYDGEDGDCDEEDSASDYEGAGARKMEAGCAFPGCNITAGLLRCVGCREVLYCGKKHQQGDWRAHRPSCKQRKRVQEQDQQKATAAEVVALAAAATAHAAAARATEAAEAVAAAVAAGEEATATAAAEAAPVTKNQSRRIRKRVRKRQAQEREVMRRKHAERFNQVLGRLRQACERRKRRCKEQRRNRRRLRKGLECYFKRRRLREAQGHQDKDHHIQQLRPTLRVLRNVGRMSRARHREFWEVDPTSISLHGDTVRFYFRRHATTTTTTNH